MFIVAIRMNKGQKEKKKRKGKQVHNIKKTYTEKRSEKKARNHVGWTTIKPSSVA